jgi:hypothetical protein
MACVASVCRNWWGVRWPIPASRATLATACSTLGQRIIQSWHVPGEHQHARGSVLALPLREALQADPQHANSPASERLLDRRPWVFGRSVR